MMRRVASVVLAIVALSAAAWAEPLVPEPDGYRTEDYRAPVPETLAGGRVLTTAEAEAIWRAKSGVFIDVLPRPPKPSNLPAGTVWRDKPRLNIPGSIWLPDTGYGELAEATENYLRQGLIRALRRQSFCLARGVLPGQLLDVVERSEADSVLRLFQCGLVSRRYRRLGARQSADGGVAAGAAAGRAGREVTAIRFPAGWCGRAQTGADRAWSARRRRI